MICPQCGMVLSAQAYQCERCGYVVGSPPIPPMIRPPARPGADLPSRPVSGPWLVPEEPLPVSGMWGPGGTSEGPLPYESSGQWSRQSLSGTPSLPRDPQNGANGRLPMPPPGPGIGGPGMARSGMLPSGPIVSASLVPSRPRPPAGIPSEIGPGVVLQRGRLRILAPFAPTHGQTSGHTNIVAWLANDAGRRGDQVVLLELPLSGHTPADANQIRDTMAARLDVLEKHPSLPRILGAFGEQGHHFLVFAAPEGEFLADRVARIGGPLPERQVLVYTAQLLETLQFLERQSPALHHGMITPDTVMISADSRTARFALWSPHQLATWIGITLQSPPPVAPGYVAPEVQRDRGIVTPRSDLYSLGATIFFALTASSGASRAAGIFPSARSLNQLVTNPTDFVIAKSVRLIPSQRYQHTDEMSLDVERASRGESPVRDALSVMAPISPSRTGQTIAWTVTGLTTLLLVGILLFVVLVRPAASTPPIVMATVVPTVAVDPTLAALAEHGEGLSTGIFIYDNQGSGAQPGGTATASTPTPDGAIQAEIEGANALKANDLASAQADFQLAVEDDHANAEARIYLANTQIAVKQAPFITMDVAVSFAPQDIATSRNVLRGVALAQQHVNAANVLPNGTMLKIEIASVGPEAEAAPQIVQYYLSHRDQLMSEHKIGVMSWSSKSFDKLLLSNLQQALTPLLQQGFPVLAPVTTTDQIPPLPNFFRLSPTNAMQGQALVQEALARSYGGSTEVVVDANNVTDLEIAAAAQVTLKAHNGYGALDEYTSAAADQGLSGLQAAAKQILYHGAQTIIFIGDAPSLTQLMKSLLALGYTPAGLPSIFAAPFADSPDLIGASNNAAAQFANANQKAMTRVNVLGLTDASEWSYLGTQNLAKNGAPNFFQSYSDTFTAGNSAFALVPSVDAILSYDTVSIQIAALLRASAFNGKQMPTPTQLIGALNAITPTTPYQGVSGLIAFSSAVGTAGIPVDRSMVLKSVVITTDHTASGQPLLGWNVLDIVGGPTAFCDVKNGCPPPA